MKQFYVYVLSSHSRVLYVGVTNNLERRLWEHRFGGKGFAAKYRASRLVYFEQTENSVAAIEREKQIKGWIRRKKYDLVERANPFWLDLAEGWFDSPVK